MLHAPTLLQVSIAPLGGPQPFILRGDRRLLPLLWLLLHLRTAVLDVDLAAQSACSVCVTWGPGFLVSLMAFCELVFRERQKDQRLCKCAALDFAYTNMNRLTSLSYEGFTARGEQILT